MGKKKKKKEKNMNCDINCEASLHTEAFDQEDRRERLRYDFSLLRAMNQFARLNQKSFAIANIIVDLSYAIADYNEQDDMINLVNDLSADVFWRMRDYGQQD